MNYSFKTPHRRGWWYDKSEYQPIMTAASHAQDEGDTNKEEFAMKSKKDADEDDCDDLDSYDALTEVMGTFGLFHLVTYLSLYASVTPHALQVKTIVVVAIFVVVVAAAAVVVFRLF